MEENTVFTSPVAQPPVVPVPTPAPTVNVAPVIKMEPVVVGPSLAPQPIKPVGGTPPPPKFSSGLFDSPIFKIVKLVGLVLVAIILIVVFTLYILPRFSKSGTKAVTITYWGLWEGENVMKPVIADFEKQNPTITIKYEKQDIKQYRERLATRIANGTGPDIFKFHNTWLPVFSSSLTPLPSDVIKKDDFAKIYYPVAQKDLIRNGAIYGIPSGIDILSMYVNKDILSAAGIDVPVTWDSFINTARKLTVKDEQGKIKTAGASLGTFDNVTNSPDIISMLLLQNGANLSDLQSTTQASVDALDFYASFAKDSSSVWDGTLDPSLLMFIKGNLAIYFGYSWDIFSIKVANPNLPFDVYPVPHLPDRNITIASYWVNGVSAKSKNQKEALLFMKFLAQKETTQKLFTEESKTRLFGEPYARTDLADTLKDNQYLAPFIAQAPNATSSHFAANTYDNGFNSQLNAYLGNAVRTVLNNESGATAIETLSQGVSQILKQYGQK